MQVECVLIVLGSEARGYKDGIQGQVHHAMYLELAESVFTTFKNIRKNFWKPWKHVTK